VQWSNDEGLACKGILTVIKQRGDIARGAVGKEGSRWKSDVRSTKMGNPKGALPQLGVIIDKRERLFRRSGGETENRGMRRENVYKGKYGAAQCWKGCECREKEIRREVRVTSLRRPAWYSGPGVGASRGVMVSGAS